MPTHTYNCTVQTENLSSYPRDDNQHIAPAMTTRWSGVYDNDHVKYNLGKNVNCVGKLTSTLLQVLRRLGKSESIQHSSFKGGFTVKSGGNEHHCDVEFVNFGYRFSGENFDKKGGYYIELYRDFIKSLGVGDDYEVVHEPYVVSVETNEIKGSILTKSTTNSTKITNEPNATKDGSGSGSDNDESGSEEDIGGLFNMF